MKDKTLVQLKCAKASADNVSKYVEECIGELEDKLIFEEPLEKQYFRIFGIKYPSERMTVTEYRAVIIPVLSKMARKDIDFFYLHYGGIIPQEYKKKYYF